MIFGNTASLSGGEGKKKKSRGVGGRKALLKRSPCSLRGERRGSEKEEEKTAISKRRQLWIQLYKEEGGGKGGGVGGKKEKPQTFFLYETRKEEDSFLQREGKGKGEKTEQRK